MSPSAAAVLDALPLAAASIKRRQATVVAPPIPPVEWATTHASVVTPEGRVPFQPYDYQTEFLRDAAPKRLVLKARQVGLSNTVAVEALYRAIEYPDRQVLFVSRNGQLAQQLVTYCRHTLASLKKAAPLTQENLSTLAFANGSRILSLPASPATGRGFPATDVYLDEFAFAEYDELIYEGIVPALAPGGTLTIFSTPNGRGNLFFRLWAGLDGGDWSRHRIHWSDCPRYKSDPSWEARQREIMTRQSFAQEYDCDFIASGDAVFDPLDLDKCGDGWAGTLDGCDRLVTGWDIGRRHDHTVGITIGRRADIWHVVAFDRFLLPYPATQAAIEARAKAYPGGHWVESNGPGDPVIENLMVRVQPFTTTPRSKLQAIQALQLLIQQGRFKYDAHGAHAQLHRELGLYQLDDANLVQDCVMAAAIAAHTADKPVGETVFW